MRPADTLVCVADAERAQFYRCDGPGRSLEPLLDLEIVIRRRPRTARPPEEEDGEKAYVAGRIAGQIERMAEKNLVEHVVLVAPTDMLGAMRHVLTARSRRLLVGEMERDLVRATPRQVAAHVRDMLPR
jgi:protein required for attachment to host cells